MISEEQLLSPSTEQGRSAMKVFISWSGDVSHKLADGFRTWLPGALQAVQPYFTPADIEKGARWGSEIAKELESSDVGVLFVTRDNIGSSWLVYEAGALSKRLDKSRVCPIIFGVTHNDLPAPLRQHQATEFKELDFKRLLKTINGTASENRLADAVLDQVFEMWWPRLEAQFTKILEVQKIPDQASPVRSDRESLEEILDLSRLNARQTARHSPSSQMALAEIARSLIATVAAIQSNCDPQAALGELSNMQKPLAHLLFRTSRSPETASKSELVDELRKLHFEHQAPEPDDDDEIPF